MKKIKTLYDLSIGDAVFTYLSGVGYIESIDEETDTLNVRCLEEDKLTTITINEEGFEYLEHIDTDAVIPTEYLSTTALREKLKELSNLRTQSKKKASKKSSKKKPSMEEQINKRIEMLKNGTLKVD